MTGTDSAIVDVIDGDDAGCRIAANSRLIPSPVAVLCDLMPINFSQTDPSDNSAACTIIRPAPPHPTGRGSVNRSDKARGAAYRLGRAVNT